MDKVHFPPVILQPAYRLAAILALVHAGIGGLLLFMPLPLWVLVMLMVGVLASAVHGIWRQALRRGSRAITRLQFRNREQLEIGRRDGSRQSGRILGSSTAGTLLTVLNIRLERQRWPVHVVVTHDSLDGDGFRRLRVWLRWGPPPEGQVME
ncbi:MAG: hypothetical protein KF771_05310 [Burkholderiales bacterium]|nr:hypothetical protein [Burkholderiales bacterium]